MTKPLELFSVRADLKKGVHIFTYEGGAKDAKAIFKTLLNILGDDPAVRVRKQDDEVSGHWQYLAIDRGGLSIFDYYRRSDKTARDEGFITVLNRRINKGDTFLLTPDLRQIIVLSGTAYNDFFTETEV